MNPEVLKKITEKQDERRKLQESPAKDVLLLVAEARDKERLENLRHILSHPEKIPA